MTNNIPISFSELWNRAEELHKEVSSHHSVQSIIQEITMKMGIYKAVDSQEDIPPDERQKIKSRTMGEILLTLTALSLKDDINTYVALSEALQFRSIDHFNGKYST